MYYGESAIINIDLNSYIDNFLNEQVFLDEISIGEIGKFIKDKLVALWNKFLEIVKIIKDKIIGFFQKIFGKNKENKDSNVDSYKTETVSKEEYDKAFNKSKEAQEKRDAKKDEPIDLGYEEIKDEMALLFEQDLKITRYCIKEDLNKSFTLDDKYDGNNFEKLNILGKCGHLVWKFFDENIGSIIVTNIDKCRSKVEYINKINKKIEELLQNIENMKYQPISLSFKELLVIKEYYGSSYLQSISSDDDVEIHAYDNRYKCISKCKLLKEIFSKTRFDIYEKDIKKQIDNVNQIQINIEAELKNDSEAKTIWNQYYNSLTEFLKLFTKIFSLCFRCLSQENSICKALERKYLEITFPYVRDIETNTVLHKDRHESKVAVRNDTKSRNNNIEKSKYDTNI